VCAEVRRKNIKELYMNTLQMLLALVVLIYVLSVIVQIGQEIFTSLVDTKSITMAKTILCLGVFMLLAVPVVQCQTGNSTPPPAKKGTDKKVTEKKGADKKNVAKKPGDTAPPGNAPANEGPKPDAAKATPAVTLENARLDAMDSDYANMSLRDCGKTGVCLVSKSDPNSGQVYHVKVNDKGLRAQLKQFHVGDHLRVDINGNNELQDLRGPWSVPTNDIPPEIPPTRRFLVLAACALAVLALAAAAAAVASKSPLSFIVGLDHRYSNSKFQIVLWFWVVISTYLAVVVFRVWYAGWDFFGGVSIPQNLLVLSGLSAITFGGAKAITTAKADAAAHPVDPPGTTVPRVAIPDPKGVTTRNAGDERFFQDLLQNDLGNVDFGDFQMLVVTLVAVVMYLTLIFHFLATVEFLKTATLPDVDTTILAGFGLGHGAYLAKKAGGNVGTS